MQSPHCATPWGLFAAYIKASQCTDNLSLTGHIIGAILDIKGRGITAQAPNHNHYEVKAMASRGFQEFRQILTEQGFSDNEALVIANQVSKEWLFYANEKDMRQEAHERWQVEQVDFSY